MIEKYRLPFKTRFFNRGGGFAESIRLLILVPFSLILFFSLIHAFTHGVSFFSILLIIANLGMLSICWYYVVFKSPLIDFFTNSYERRQGIITNAFLTPEPTSIKDIKSENEYTLEIDNDASMQYRVYSKLPTAQKWRDRRDVVSAIGYEVEIIYGQRSKFIIMANVLAEGSLDEKSTQEISEE